LEEIGTLTLLARLKLQVGWLAADQFPEAAEAAREAEDYFHDRGADAFVATFRAKAVGPQAIGREPAARAPSATLAEAEPSAR
jgi:hypothetical protein